MAGGKGVKNKQKVKTAKKATPKAAKSKKAVKAPKKMPNAGQRKKTGIPGKNASKGGTGKSTAKSPGKNNTAVGKKKTTVKMPGAAAVCKALRIPEPKTATPPGKKIMGVKLTAGTNLGVWPSSKPIKKKTIKVQASGAIPGTSQNTGQTSTKIRAPKRKLDQPKQATPSIKKIRINIPKPEIPRFEDKRPILINMVQPVQSNPPPIHNTFPVQQHYHYHQKREDFQIQEGPRHRDMSVPGWKANNHFVDKHRKDLISRVPLVDPILDSLMAENVLNDEQYDNIRSKPTTQEKMRELYKYITGIGDSAKDKFYDALENHNDLLIQDLKGT
ncbi:uncharacterized protein [Aquarana catesbeiana]|uniref:uncharacterized protein isoform X1 n=1 Tax=Aquarana catesbeiana TaxID=8400 RepID=UPI003CC93179